MTAPGGPRAPRPNGRGPASALAGVLVLALGLRLLLWANRRGTLWFEEDVPLAWAWRLWGFDRGQFDPNPHSAIWPHLSVYLYFVVQGLQYAAGRLAGTFAGLADFRAAALADPLFLRGAAMLAAIAIGLATLAASAHLARRVAGPWAAVAAALVLAVDPLFLRYSLAISPDMPLTFCGVMGLLACLNVVERGRLRDSLAGGAWLGLGAACKYSPILLALPMLLAHASRPGGRRGVGVLGDARLWLAAAVSVLAFALTSPFTLLDLAARWSQFQVGAGVLVHAPAGAVRTYAATEFLAHTLPADLGWPLYAALAAAAVWALVRGGVRARLLVSFALANLAVFGFVPAAFERYLMPAYPPLLAVAALAAGSGLRHARGRAAVAVWAVLAFAAFAWPAWTFVREYRQPDSRALARDWVLAHVPDGATVALEFLGPELPDRAGHTKATLAPGLSARWRARLERGPAYYVSPQPLSFPAPEITTRFYVPTRCAGFDYVITSAGVSGRYLTEPARFPVQCDFYEALERFALRLYRTPPAGRSGPEIGVFRTYTNGSRAMAIWWAARSPARSAQVPPEISEFEARQFAQRACVLSAGNRYGPALESWRLALQWPAAPPGWWYGAGLCAAFAGDMASTRAYARTAYERLPSFPAAGVLWARAEWSIGDRDSCERLAQLLVRRGGLTPDQLGTLAALRAAR